MNTNFEPQIRVEHIEHTDVSTGLSYEALVRAFEHELGHWDSEIATRLVVQKAPWSEVEQQVSRLGGPRGLMVLSQVDQGTLTSLSGQVKRCSLYLVGNPVIVSQILDMDPRAAFFVPFRVCLYDDGGMGGAVISYDRPSSFLAVLGNPELTEIGILLDGKIDGVAQALVQTDG